MFDGVICTDYAHHETVGPDAEYVDHGATQPPPPSLMATRTTIFGLESVDAYLSEPAKKFALSLKEINYEDNYDNDEYECENEEVCNKISCWAN